MKTVLILVVLLCAVRPTLAQSSKVYTNADLGKRTVAWTRTVTPAELAGLKAREFVYVPDRGPRPREVVVRSAPGDGPFGPFAPPIPDRRLDGSQWSDPPWEMRAYGGYGHRGYGAGVSRTAGGHPAPVHERPGVRPPVSGRR